MKDICARAVNDVYNSSIDPNNPICINIILKNALLSVDPIAKITNILAQQIGVLHADCYCKLSILYEKKNDMHSAKEILEMAKSKGAIPRELILQNLKELEKRMHANKVIPFQKQYMTEKIIVQNSNICFHTYGCHYIPKTNWTYRVKDKEKDLSISIEEYLCAAFAEGVEPIEEPMHSTKSMIVLNEDMEVESVLSENDLNKTISDSSSIYEHLFIKEKQPLFSDHFTAFSVEKENTRPSYGEAYCKQLF